MSGISRIALKNYKNLRVGPEGLRLGKLNMVIGPNGSGKSNLIRLFAFLRHAWLPADEPEKPTNFERAIIDLGDSSVLDSTLSPPATVNFGFEFNISEATPLVNLELELLLKGGNTSPVVKREMLYRPANNEQKEPFYYYKAHDPESGTALVYTFADTDHKDGELKKIGNIPANRLFGESFWRLPEMKSLLPANTPVYYVAPYFMNSVLWRFYNANDMNLAAIRNSEPKIQGAPDAYISASGENLPLVLEGLIQKDFTFEETINDEMRKILPLTRKIRVVRSGRLRLTVEWYMKGMKDPFYLADMSDGTVRMLIWGTILNSPAMPPLLVIDEPEVGLHPAWMITLAEWIKKASERTQVIVTTHSPDLLDHFTDRYEDVICFDYDGKNHFTPKRLPTEWIEAKLGEGWDLGDLYRAGDPAMGGWPW